MGARRVLVAALVAAFAAALVAVCGPAAAAVAPRADARTAGDGIVALQSEVLALVELDAWPAPVPRRLRDVHDEYASYVEGLGRAALVDWVLSADRDGERVLARMRTAGDRPTGAEVTALGRLTEVARRALTEGTRFPVPADDYVHALDDLEARAAGEVPLDGRAPAPTGAVPAAGTTPGPGATSGPAAPRSTATGAATVTAAATSGPAASGATSSGAASPGWLLAAAGAVVALLVGAGGVVARRGRRRAPVMSARQVVGLLDAGRLLSDARDVAGVAAVAAAELGRLVRVPGTLLVGTDGGREPAWTVLADPQGLLAPGTSPGGVLARVAATGQGTVQTVDGDPALGPCAVLAVPVLVGGAVRAVLGAVRPAAQPFGADDLRVAAELAPLVASALQGAAALEDVRAQAGRDALTGLPNRRSLDADLHAELGRQEGRTTAVVMVDVDHFKAFNDREGHAGGDLALRAVATALAASVRAQDRAYRYGGEEFCLLLRQVTRAEAAGVLEAVFAAVRAADVPGAARQPAGHLSVSAGVALVGGTEPADAVRRADEALYEAKRTGRDRFVVADDGPGSTPRGPAAPPAQRRAAESDQGAPSP